MGAVPVEAFQVRLAVEPLTVPARPVGTVEGVTLVGKLNAPMSQAPPTDRAFPLMSLHRAPIPGTAPPLQIEFRLCPAPIRGDPACNCPLFPSPRRACVFAKPCASPPDPEN